MITCNLMGGLGNQLFQIFATISYSIKSGNKFKFLNIDKLGKGNTTIRYTYWKSFFSSLKFFLIKELPSVHVIREKCFSYNELPVNEMKNNNVIIFGYFQSYKYFNENYNTIYKLLTIDKIKNELVNNYEFTQDYLDNCISIHFRLGDYKKLQHYYSILTYEYYEKALIHINNLSPEKKYDILFFCENEDIDDVMVTINKLINKFPIYNFKRANNKLQDWEHLILMSLCNHNIIANSSFSWWSAYLNSHKDKVICYPSIWFGESVNHDTSDLCPPDWVKINI